MIAEEVAKRVQLKLEPTVASAIAKLVEIAYAKLGPTVPFINAGKRQTERREVSRFKFGEF